MSHINFTKFRQPREFPISERGSKMPPKNSPISLLPGVKINTNISTQDCQRILDLMNSSRNNVEVNVKAKLPQHLEDLPSSQYRPSGLSQKRSQKSSQTSNRLKQLPLTTVSNSRNTVMPSMHAPSTSRAHTNWEKRVFQVVYGRHKPYKKNKEWTYDGFIVISKNSVALHDCSGSSIGRNENGSTEVPKKYSEGSRIVIGSFECELSTEISVADFESGAFFADDQ